MIFNHPIDSPEKLENMELEEKLETFGESWREDQKLLNDELTEPIQKYEQLTREEVFELWKGNFENRAREHETVLEQPGYLDKLLKKD